MSIPHRKKIKRAIIGRIVLLFVWLVRRLPRRLSHTIGAWGGVLAWRLSPMARENIDRHLTLVYGAQMTSAQRHALGRRFYVHSGRNLIDIARLPAHLHDELLPRIHYDGMHHWDAAMARGNGAFGLTGHLGNFELLAAAMQAHSKKVAVIGRELSNPTLNQLIISTRQSAGLTNFLTTDSPRKLLQWLRGGGAIGVLIDTDSHRVRSEIIPFMGQPANTPIGHAALALASGAAIVPLACVRTADDAYTLIARPEIQFVPTGDRDADIRELTRLCNLALEELVRAYPDQWIWLHHRWRIPPSGENPNPPQPDENSSLSEEGGEPI